MAHVPVHWGADYRILVPFLLPLVILLVAIPLTSAEAPDPADRFRSISSTVYLVSFQLHIYIWRDRCDTSSDHESQTRSWSNREDREIAMRAH